MSAFRALRPGTTSATWLTGVPHQRRALGDLAFQASDPACETHSFCPGMDPSNPDSARRCCHLGPNRPRPPSYCLAIGSPARFGISHSRTVPSQEAEASTPPSGEKATLFTSPLCPEN